MEPKKSIEIVGEGETSVADLQSADQPGFAAERFCKLTQSLADLPVVPAVGLEGTKRLPIMPKVATYIRQTYNSEDYEPLVATFGPYNRAPHHADDSYNRLALVEKFKVIALAWFIQGTGKDANYWLRKAWNMMPDLRCSYGQEFTSYSMIPHVEFTQLMLLDACLAILIMGVANQVREDINLLFTHLGPATLDAIIRDSFLLENQLPFWFIKDLLYEKFGDEGKERWRNHFLFLCHGIPKPANDTTKTTTAAAATTTTTTTTITTTTTTTTPTVYWDEEAGEPAHFVEALKVAHLSGWKKENKELKHHAVEVGGKVVLSKENYAVHSVTELKAKGINLKRNSTNSFKDITFQPYRFSGTLKIPVDILNHGSKAAYSNMIAYEMSPENHTKDHTMTAYVHLMKSLVQTPKDVEELQANGIIINRLGSNKQVVKLYSDIYTFGTICSDTFREVCKKMDDHYDNPKKTWLPEFLNTYFGSPWSAMAFFGSVLIGVLTMMQVYYAATDDKGNNTGKSPP